MRARLSLREARQDGRIRVAGVGDALVPGHGGRVVTQAHGQLGDPEREPSEPARVRGAGFERVVLHQGVPRGRCVAELLGGVREVDERHWLRRLLADGLLEHLLRRQRIGGLQQRAAQQHERFRIVVGARRRVQRFERFLERDAILARLGEVQPHAAERDVGVGVVRIAARRRPERLHCVCGIADRGVRQPQRDLARRPRLERPQHGELGDAIVGPSEPSVDVGELFPRLQHRRRQLDGSLQRDQRLARLLRVAQAEPEHVLRLGELRLDDERAFQRRDAGRRLGGAVLREPQLVEKSMRAVVEGDVFAVALGGAIEAPHRVADVPQQLARPRRHRIEIGRPAEISPGRPPAHPAVDTPRRASDTRPSSPA